MTPALARRIALATLDPVMFDIVYDTAWCVAVGQPVQVDYGFTTAEIATARADRTVLVGVYREVSARQDFTTATLIARLGWLAGLEADGEADRRRLDWLEKQTWKAKFNPHVTPTQWEIESVSFSPPVVGPTLRAAIDAAMADWAAQGGP